MKNKSSNKKPTRKDTFNLDEECLTLITQSKKWLDSVLEKLTNNGPTPAFLLNDSCAEMSVETILFLSFLFKRHGDSAGEETATEMLRLLAVSRQKYQNEINAQNQ